MHDSTTLPMTAPPPIVGSTHDATAAAAAGLVSCAITQTDPVADLLRDRFRFPSADLLDAAASMFPTPARGPRIRNISINPKTWQVTHGTLTRPGSWPQVEIAPGLVRLRRVDHARREATAERIRRSRARVVDQMIRDDRFIGPREQPLAERTIQAVDQTTGEVIEHDRDEAPARGLVTGWSRKSRANMIATIASLDLAPLVESTNLPALVTLTLPGIWLAAAPDAATASEVFNRFTSAYRKKWGPLVCIWKREFQRRGAPHWHLWMVPPVPAGRMREFAHWLSLAWTTALALPDELGPKDHPRVPVGGGGTRQRPCTCSEWCRSVSAGTGIDFAEGLRARDPKRLAVYFLKESTGSSDGLDDGKGKAYQNLPPKEWGEGASVGRYWGYKGIEKAVRIVGIDPDAAPRVVRVLRHLRESRGGVRPRTVPRLNERTQRVSYRTVNRPVRGALGAGWVAVNDGAAVGAAIARVLAPEADGIGVAGLGRLSTRVPRTGERRDDSLARPVNICKRQRPSCRCDRCAPVAPAHWRHESPEVRVTTSEQGVSRPLW